MRNKFMKLNNCTTALRQKGGSLINPINDYTIFDVETTGLDPKWCEIIEIAAIKVRNDEIIETFNSLVKPSSEIDDFIILSQELQMRCFQMLLQLKPYFPNF